ncbi:MAG: dihydrodipicolinate synthase family protein, partial [Gemmatimonadaceae bacterium]
MSATRKLAGVLAPVVTPFRSNGAVDTAAFVTNVRAHLRAGLSGVLVAGSTGEAALLREAERARLVAMAREVVPKSKWVLAGVGAESTWQAVERARDAAREGADLALALPPHYFAGMYPDAAIERYFLTLADESPVPLLLYNMPKYTHVVLAPELVHRLSEHPNVVGMKDSGGEPERLSRYLEVQGDDFTVLTGHAPTFREARRRGACGGILAAALFAPELCVRVDKKPEQQSAEQAQARLSPLGRDIVGALGPAGVKAAMDAVGLRGGHVRPPLL